MELDGPPGLRQGAVNDHALYQPVIHVAADGRSAKVRVRELIIKGRHSEEAILGGAVHENEFVKRDGRWQIKSDHGYVTFLADYTKGWSQGALPAPVQSSELRPDRPPSSDYKPFPAFRAVPFHYPNPVTGQVPTQTGDLR